MAIQGLISKSVILLFLLVFLLGACDSQETNSLKNIPVVQIDSLELFLDFNNSGIVQPADIEVLKGNKIAVLDNKLNQVLVFNRDGELKFHFGSDGRGPGEFVLSMYLQRSSKFLNVIDVMQYKINQFNYSGEFVQSYKYHPHAFSRRALVLEEKKYLIEAMGEKNKLIKLVDAESDTVIYFGKAMGKYEEIFSMEMGKKALKNRKIPPVFKNHATMYYSGDNLYAFLNSYSRLQKYNSKRELIWDKKIDLPVNQKIFDDIVTIARNNNGPGIPALIYLHSMKVAGGETYLLWHGTREKPQRIVKVDKKGEIEKIFILPRDHSYGEIAVDKQNNLLYIASGNSGLVFREQLDEL